MQCLSKLLWPSDPIQPCLGRCEGRELFFCGRWARGCWGSGWADIRLLKSLFCTRTPSRGQAPGLWWGFHLTRAGAITNIHVNTSMKGERWAGLECNYTIICGKCKTDEDFWIFLFIWYVSLINPEEQFRCCHYTWCNTETMNGLSKASVLGGGVETGSMYPSTVLNLCVFTYLPVCCDYRHVPPHPVQRIVLI